MTEEEIFNKISAMIADNFDIDQDKITKDTDFTNDLDADSIDLVEFILQLEDEFGAEIPDEEAEKIKTVGDAVAYVKRYHYLDDARYARTFIRFHQGERSRKRLETDLLRRGVPGDVIADSMEREFSSDEKEQIRRLLEKKQFSADTADEKELRRMYGYLMRRGFRGADILSVLRTDSCCS